MLVQIDNITKQYTSDQGKIKRTVLHDCNLEIEKGDSIGIIGPSGSGKTTLLNLIGALDLPTEGTVSFNGNNIAGYNTKQTSRYLNENIGFVFQLHHLLPQCNLLENVLVPTLVNNKSKKESLEYAETLLRKLNLWDIRHQKPSEMSGGECQRTALARALINKPDIILADEPTGSLDEQNAMNLVDILLGINKNENVTLVVVSHSMDVAFKMDKVYELKHGKLTKTTKNA
ncbi:MAG: ABC transporter ATP-binding protein [Bacteroidales bacterium]|nr:ABC transporter ATP-binding protein [Bacteroidales bacterium]